MSSVFLNLFLPSFSAGEDEQPGRLEMIRIGARVKECAPRYIHVRRIPNGNDLVAQAMNK
jgi:hypothetical protein